MYIIDFIWGFIDSICFIFSTAFSIFFPSLYEKLFDAYITKNIDPVIDDYIVVKKHYPNDIKELKLTLDCYGSAYSSDKFFNLQAKIHDENMLPIMKAYRNVDSTYNGYSAMAEYRNKTGNWEFYEQHHHKYREQSIDDACTQRDKTVLEFWKSCDITSPSFDIEAQYFDDELYYLYLSKKINSEKIELNKKLYRILRHRYEERYPDICVEWKWDYSKYAIIFKYNW